MKLFNRDGYLHLRYKDYAGVEKKVSLKLKDNARNRKLAMEKLIPELKAKLELDIEADVKLSFYLNKIKEDSCSKKPSTQKTYENACREIVSYFGDVDIDCIKIANIDKFIEHLQKKNYSTSTIKTYLAPINLAFKEAMRLEVISKNPASFAKIAKVKKEDKVETFSKDEIALLLQNAKDELKVFLMIAFYTGARRGEIVSLRWSDYNGKYLRIERTRVLGDFNSPKNGKARVIPVVQELGNYLDNLDRDKSAYILGSLVEPSSIYHKFKKLQKELGIEYRSPHKTRHTVASLMLSSKENIMLIQAMLGHKDLKMINEIYGHYIENDNDLIEFRKSFGTLNGTNCN